MRFKMLAGGGAEAQPPVMRIVSTRGIGAVCRGVINHALIGYKKMLARFIALLPQVGIIERSGRPPLQNPGFRKPFSVGYGRGFATPSPTATFLNRYAIL